ncbi:MAG: hypothetical protein HYY98_10940 [Burkholderiales bacterium]|nr:hypothetical protein [Burkholderiales bacterium]
MNQPSPAIVPQSAVRRLPRWALFLLCTAYILPGFVGRNPWRGADMAALGYMLELAGGHTPWMAPLLGGLAPETDGMLPYWLGAWAIQLADPWLAPELAARIPFVLLMALTLLSAWYGIYALARNPGAQPVAFAFGGEAQPADYARAMADGGLLALLACLGLAQPTHETTSYLVQLCCTALVFYGLATGPQQKTLPAMALAAGLAGLVLSGAPALAVFYTLGVAVLYWFDASENPGDRALSRRWSTLALAMALASGALAWWLDAWRWKLAWPQDLGKDWLGLARLFVWFTWPAWPLALWTVWRWRRQILHRHPHRHLLLPLWFVLMAMVCAAGTLPSDRALLLGLPALAALAAFALPTLRRSMSALVDWFTLLFFSASVIAIWVIWISTQTGFPAKPAANVAKLVRGFEPQFSAIAFAVALAGTLAWCALVWWRAGRHRSAIWKTLVLPAAGTTLCWLLLTTLWMPMLDYARSDVPQMRTLAQLAGQPACMHMYGLERTQIAALQFHGRVRLVPLEEPPRCDWLVNSPQASSPTAQNPLPEPDLHGWTLQHSVDRPRERSEVLELYLRDAPHD